MTKPRFRVGHLVTLEGETTGFIVKDFEMERES